MACDGDRLPFAPPAPIKLADGILLLPGRADAAVLSAAEDVLGAAPPRVMIVPGGKRMSVAMTNCGALGWISDAEGYRYTAEDPATGRPWPVMPEALRRIAVASAAEAGYPGFDPEACLVNLYGPSSRMGLHQDRDEREPRDPIVSVSLGRSALFRVGGLRRRDPTRSVMLHHGDVLVFGGPARMVYHGVDRLAGPPHPLVGDRRINLTFRRVNPRIRG